MTNLVFLVAAVLVAEAGGENRKGLEAVREVIHNRAVASHKTEAQVVTARKQFSCLNNTTPDELVERAKRHPHWQLAVTLASHPPNTDWTTGANHYYAPAGVKRPPKWADETKRTAVIGRHRFYKL